MNAEIETGVPTRLCANVLRLTAANAGLMTGPGTNTYLLGNDEVAVIDPGPLIEDHIHAIIDAAPGPINRILATHTHPDHSPAAATLAARTGAEVIGLPAPDGPHQDRSFRPQYEPSNGEVLSLGGIELSCIYTPGHASNHICYQQLDNGWLYTGDHIMNGSTVVIDPPDGNMSDYLESLGDLQGRGLAAIAPGHGKLLADVDQVIQWIIDHRLARESKIVTGLTTNPGSTVRQLVAIVYDEVDPGLHRLAERSLLAHLLKLEQEGVAAVSADCWSMISTA